MASISKCSCYVLLIVSLVLQQGCIYRFTDTALPSHIKNVQIPLLFNESEQSGIAEEVTEKLDKKFRQGGISLVARNSDAIVRGKIIYYKSQPSLYKSDTPQDVDIKSYTVTLKVEIDFFDLKKNKSIYKGTIETEGNYDTATEKEKDGRKRAVDNFINRFFENAFQNW